MWLCAARWLSIPLVAALALTACGRDGGSASSTVGTGGELRFTWVMPEGFPAVASLHHALPDQPPAQTRSFGPGEEPPAGSEIVGGVLPVRFDEPQRVVLRLRNPLDRPVRFWAAPHLRTPHEGLDALMVLCLCTGETYEIPAHGSWTRVMEFGIRRRDAVSPLRITHVITLGEAPHLD